MRNWTSVKESYPESLVFHEDGGLLVVRGRDVEVLAREFGIQTRGSWLGFDQEQGWGYISELVDRGYDVVKASAGRVSRVRRVPTVTAQLRRERARGKSVALEAGLVFDRAEVDRTTSGAWLRRRGYEELLGTFQRCLRSRDWRLLREYGELCVYQVGDWYEVDIQLSSMKRDHVWLLAKAALAFGCDLPCLLVPPRCRRSQARALAPLEMRPLGQLSFEELVA